MEKPFRFELENDAPLTSGVDVTKRKGGARFQAEPRREIQYRLSSDHDRRRRRCRRRIRDDRRRRRQCALREAWPR